MFKKTKLSILILSFAGAHCSFAGTMGDVNAEDSTKHLFFSVAPIYGMIDDGGISKTPMSDLVTPGGYLTTTIPRLTNDWGYALNLGYQFGAENSNLLVLGYTHLSTNSNTRKRAGVEDSLLDRIGVIPTNGIAMDGPATAAVKTNYLYQTLELTSQRTFQNVFVKEVEFSRFFGIKATELKRTLNAHYNGTQIVDPNPPSSFSNIINYQAKYYGIGPRIGMGARWNITHIFSIGGDASASLLVGGSSSKWTESLVTPEQTLNVYNVPTIPGAYALRTKYPSAVWVAPILAGNVMATANVKITNGNMVRVDFGIGSETYLPNYSKAQYGLTSSQNKVNFTDSFQIRNVFLRFSYLS